MTSKTLPRYNAACEWIASARKNEEFVYWRGRIDRACNTPESNMSNAERRDHQAACRAAKKAKKPLPLPPDPYADMREDARALVGLVEHWELRGLVELKTVVLGKHDYVYEMRCIVQRNGLAAVRSRK